ncbi:hypothetical protein KUTeg_002447 [Tegillarca granosa]|uniref:5'-3' exoribonuclease 1 n=1 Tax=Tegillarca granosa TaxID=220873 RepID=A0ABQ9FX58_TEGGR|nr:hypothetical protein KUTeg_002447 [Tegillarca granosa]
MGVPKFYRWISERYPCLSEVVKEFQIPEFDNMYLDMNGIIHVCSHPEDNNPHFRITEEKIFSDIFHYLECLFRMIKPRKVFYMAIDGVAPRAKMNQQRGRRFRSAREAEELERKARESGEILPKEKRFDSNCITPGTEFMVKLQEQLKYFCVSKMSTDPIWRGVKVYLSGHETPGEGEHKIMDFIRKERSKPDYDENTRHCLYGLDADLMMLGLATHEPHFSLLREEVRFGGKKDQAKRPATVEETTFHLLHLSLFREYLDFEFSPLKNTLPFPYDLESIIDDWVMMGFLVGNDFIPHLPHLHIHHDALPLLWKTYIKVLPSCGGYINEGGHLNLKRFEKYLEELTKFDVEKFNDIYTDLKWFEGKKLERMELDPADKPSEANKKQKKKDDNQFAALADMDDEDEIGDEFFQDEGVASSVENTDTLDDDEEEDEEEDEDEDGDTFDVEFRMHKRHYYMDKMEYESVTTDVLRDQAEGYVRGIQWILLYYYEGCPSWSWFYPHHYAPYISDVKDFSSMKIDFEIGKPFLPFQQLMAVLPAASKELLPAPYQKLMTTEESPVKDFYPVDFRTDLNGKLQEWEAVVLVPFIDENRLLLAMESVYDQLSESEKARNRHGPCYMYEYVDEFLDAYPTSLPGTYPDIAVNHALCTKIPVDELCVHPSMLRKGLLDTVKLDVFFPGFPTLKHIPHKAELKKEGVKVFQMASRNDNMMLHIIHDDEEPDIDKVAKDILGRTIFVGWPHLYEAKVVCVYDESYRFSLIEQAHQKHKGHKHQETVKKEPSRDKNTEIFYKERQSIKERYHDRLGVVIGNTSILVQALPMTGRKYICGSHGNITLEKQFGTFPVTFAYQATVKDITVHDPSFCQYSNLSDLFAEKTEVFMLGWPHYGCQGEVIEVESGGSPRVRISVAIPEEPDFNTLAVTKQYSTQQYFPGHNIAQRLGISPYFLSRITGCILIKRGAPSFEKEASGHPGNSVNVGLNLKFTKRNEECPGYTKFQDGWLYSQKTMDILAEYMKKFPELMEYISSKDQGRGDIYYETKVFGENGKERFEELQEYLKGLPCKNAKTQKSGADILEEDMIKTLEAEVAKAVENNKKKIKRVKMQVKPHLLFKPLVRESNLIPDEKVTIYLLDRVVNIRPCHSIPFGLRGTVVGIHPAEREVDFMYDVVFDEEFTGGISLRCSPNKGYRVSKSAIINITYGERKHGAKPEQPSISNEQYSLRPGGRSNFNSNQNQSNYSDAGSGRSYSDMLRQQGQRQKQAWDNDYRNDNRYYGDREENYYNDNKGRYSNSGYTKSDKQYQNRVENQNNRQDLLNRQQNYQDGQTSKRDNQQNQQGGNRDNWRQTAESDSWRQDNKPGNKQSNQLNNMTPQKAEYLRSQSFDNSDSSTPPQFVTPKLPGQKAHTKRDSSGNQNPNKMYPNNTTGGSEFANMWKELQSSPRSTDDSLNSEKRKPSSTQGPSLSAAAAALDKIPKQSMAPPGAANIDSDQPQPTTKLSIENLFTQASQSKKSLENNEFSAMFKSLQLSSNNKTEDDSIIVSAKQLPEVHDKTVEDGTTALKQMLHIESDEKTMETDHMEIKSENKTYGRQVSVQELFEVAKQQPPISKQSVPPTTQPPPNMSVPPPSTQKQNVKQHQKVQPSTNQMPGFPYNQPPPPIVPPGGHPKHHHQMTAMQVQQSFNRSQQNPRGVPPGGMQNKRMGNPNKAGPQ